MSEEAQGPPLAPPDDDGRPLGENSGEAQAGDMPGPAVVVLVCPVCGLAACKHNLPLVEAPE